MTFCLLSKYLTLLSWKCFSLQTCDCSVRLMVADNHLLLRQANHRILLLRPVISSKGCKATQTRTWPDQVHPSLPGFSNWSWNTFSFSKSEAVWLWPRAAGSHVPWNYMVNPKKKRSHWAVEIIRADLAYTRAILVPEVVACSGFL